MNKKILVAILLVVAASLQEISLNAMLKKTATNKFLKYTLIGAGTGTLGGIFIGDKFTYYDGNILKPNELLGKIKCQWDTLAVWSAIGALSGTFAGKKIFLKYTKFGKYLHEHTKKEKMPWVTYLIKKEYSSNKELFEAVDKCYLVDANPRYEAFDQLTDFYQYNKTIKTELTNIKNKAQTKQIGIEAEQEIQDIILENEKIQKIVLVIKGDESWNKSVKLHELEGIKDATIDNASANHMNATANTINAVANMSRK